MSARFVVMVSGGGTNLQALMDAISSGEVNASIALVVSSRKDAFALERAAKAGLDVVAAVPPRGSSQPGSGDDSARRAYDRGLAESIALRDPDYILLLGWMRILTEDFIGRFPGRIVNLHPALPGTFAGTNAIERAWEAHERGEIAMTGVMIHFVPDARVDAGPVIGVKTIEFLAGESFEHYEARMHAAEHRLVVETAANLAEMAVKGERR
jgi:phosphoribosylglycinamide formyltransferase-1